MSNSVAVIFTSTRTLEHDESYERWSNRMVELVREQPGFIEYVSARDPRTRLGITVSYFVDEESVLQRKQNAEHLEAQRLGQRDFYESYSLKVANVFREYEMKKGHAGPPKD
jgi:heme-degrading monooxygenase HmoA